MAHILPGSLYSHFESKVAILKELMDSYYADLLPCQRAVLEGPGTSFERMQRMVVEVVAVAHQRPEVAMRSCDLARNRHHSRVGRRRRGFTGEEQPLPTPARGGDAHWGTARGHQRRSCGAVAGSATVGLIDRRYLIPSEAGGQGTDFDAEEISSYQHAVGWPSQHGQHQRLGGKGSRIAGVGTGRPPNRLQPDGLSHAAKKRKTS